MKQVYSVLIIEDHPLTALAYRNALKQIEADDDSLRFHEIKTVNTCEEAHERISMAAKQKMSQMIFLDIQLPPSKRCNMISGEDLGLEIRKVIPDAIILVATMLQDNFRISNIIRSIDPDAFLIKNDLDPQVLKKAIKEVTIKPPYYTKSILQTMRKQVLMGDMIDQTDRRIIYELSNGYKTKELPELVSMSMAGVEKRKRLLKEIFGAKNCDDRALIAAAKEKGFI